MVLLIFETVFFIKAKAQISLYSTAFGYASKSFGNFFFENQGILGRSIMLITDWLIKQFLQKNESGNLYREQHSSVN